MKNIILCIIILTFTFACSDKKDIETAKDNISKNTTIESVVKAKSQKLTEGNKFFINGEIEKAIEYYKKDLTENRALAYYNMGVSYYILNDFENSEKYFQLALKENPDFEQAITNLAAAQLMLNKLDKAEETIKKLLPNTKSPKILINAANIFFKKGDTAKAYIYFKKAAEIAPNSNYVKFNLGNFYIGIGEFKKGITLLESLDYDTYASNFNLAKAYYQLKKYKTSIKYIKNALRKKETVDAYLILAKNYIALNDFILASEAYSQVVRLSPTLENQLKYAEYLFLSGDLILSERVLRKALKEFPKSIDIYELLYKILDFKGDRNSAQKIAENAYETVKSDRAFYLYAKDIMYFHKKTIGKLKQKIESKENSPYLNLARALYYIRLKNYEKAMQVCNKIDENKYNDTHIYKAFLYYKSGDYNSAEKHAVLTDKYNHSYLYMNFVIFWDKREHNKLKSLISEVKKLNSRNKYRPKISFGIKPLAYDLDFSYRFDGSISSFINILLLPQTIEPNEMISFMALGYKLINDNEELKALQELKKSIEFSKGIEFNNIGVNDFIKGNYKSALINFQKAEKKLKKNPFVYFNLGVTWLNLGNLKKAFEFFDKSVLFNRFMFPAYLGKASILEMYGKKEKAQFEYDNVLNNITIFKNSDKKIPPYFIYAKYLALYALGKQNLAFQEILDSDIKNEYIKGLTIILDYLINHDLNKINNLKNVKIFRNEMIVDLVNTLNNKIKNNHTSKDRVYNYMIKYAAMLNKHYVKTNENTNDVRLMNEIAMTDLVFQNDKKTLDMMKKITNKKFNYAGLYKTSFYYYLWKKDFINAEASAYSLRNLNEKDIYTNYYGLLLLLLNYNEKRLQKRVNKYIENYPVDSRGLVIDLLNSFKAHNIKRLYNDILSLEQLDPEYMKKVSIQINLEDL